MKVKCLIDHAGIVFAGKIYEVKEKHKGEMFGDQVKIEGSDGFPVWLSESYRGIKEYEIIEE